MKKSLIAVFWLFLTFQIIFTGTVITVSAQNRWTSLLNQYQNHENVHQMIFVKYKGKSKAEVILYTKQHTKWKKKLSCTGYVGKKGINKKKEGDKKTPTGTHHITGAFGIKKDPGAKIKYQKVNKYLYWCTDKKYYNRLIDIRIQKHKCHGEHLIKYKPHYNYGLFLDYNKSGKYKKGSAIFMHCKGKNNYTAGCIAVSQKNMIKIIKTIEDGTLICIYNK